MRFLKHGMFHEARSFLRALLGTSFGLSLQSKNTECLPIAFIQQHQSVLCMGKPLGSSWAVEE